jgi:hypothetical protein
LGEMGKRRGKKNFYNFDSIGYLGKQVGVTKVAIVNEFVKFGCEKMRENELRGGILSGSKPRVGEREREKYVTDEKKLPV